MRGGRCRIRLAGDGTGGTEDEPVEEEPGSSAVGWRVTTDHDRAAGGRRGVVREAAQCCRVWQRLRGDERKSRTALDGSAPCSSEGRMAMS